MVTFGALLQNCCNLDTNAACIDGMPLPRRSAQFIQGMHVRRQQISWQQHACMWACHGALHSQTWSLDFQMHQLSCCQPEARQTVLQPTKMHDAVAARHVQACSNSNSGTGTVRQLV